MNKELYLSPMRMIQALNLMDEKGLQPNLDIKQKLLQ